uniref:WD repeat-containing protein 91 homolog n=1 Tax=Tanacetum cinerariifolium TaxID=118510 RepID=A0A6L2MSN4_TANCI|nr:WD repeat-containing protein 91 homolog [Tanacetum cinerariifolium]
MSEDSNDIDSDSYLLDDNSGMAFPNFLKKMHTHDPQETGLRPSFGEVLGHASPISCRRFFKSEDNIISASVDVTVRIWTYDSSTLASRNAAIYYGVEIVSLE